MKKSIYEEYYEEQLQAEQRYGPRTVVLMQVGKFYEIYEYEPEHDLTVKNEEQNNEQNNTNCKTNCNRIGKVMEIGDENNLKIHLVKPRLPHTRNNPYTAGFPKNSYQSNIDDKLDMRTRLLQNNWTIVRIDQKEASDHNGKIKTVLSVDGKAVRYVAETASPGTEIISSSESMSLTNYITVIYIEAQQVTNRVGKFNIIAGIASVDLTTGQTEVSECYSEEKSPGDIIKELYRYLLSKRPVEIVFYISHIPADRIEEYKSYLEKNLKLYNYPIVIFRTDSDSKDKKFIQEAVKLDYQKSQLEKVYYHLASQAGANQTITTQSSASSYPLLQPDIIDKLGLVRKPYSVITLVMMMNYIYEHNENILVKIQKPKSFWLDEHDHLILSHNSVVQANLYPEDRMFHRFNPIKSKKNITSLLEVLDNTSTKMGMRKLQRRLYNPLTNPAKLQSYYDMVEELLEDNFWVKLEPELKSMPDLERLHRMLILRTIRPADLAKLFSSYLKVINISQLVRAKPCLAILIPNNSVILEFNKAIQLVWEKFDLKKLQDCSPKSTGKLFDCSDGVIEYVDYPLINDQDDYQKLVQLKTRLQILAQTLNKWAKGRGRDIEFRDDLGGKRGSEGGLIDTTMGFITSKTRAKNLEKEINSGNPELLEVVAPMMPLTFDNIKDGTVITSKPIREACLEYNNMKIELKQKLYREFSTIVDQLQSDFAFYNSISDFVAEIDFVKSHAKTAHRYNYFKPEIDPTLNGPSYIYARDLRHPIVERIRDAEYITNDIFMGPSNCSSGTSSETSSETTTPQSDKSTQSAFGILLYGANQAGKSTLSKSIGLAVIMAQIGCYTAGKIQFRPYYKIITRLTGNDNLIEGKSSFIVELSEILTIEHQADAKTLVIGDELCRGTDAESGISLTVDIIELLIRTQSSFIFSTHMHSLTKLEEIRVIPTDKLRICHLKISYDREQDNIIYDRKICEGSGPSNYGLETAKYVGFSPGFIERAFQIRRSLLRQSQNLINIDKKSNYNARVYMDHCMLCGSKELMLLETHHIREQQTADKKGFIDHFHKNNKFNLLVACRKCHHIDIHGQNKEVKIDQTIKGQQIRLVDKK